MKIACIIVDDEPLALDVLSSLIARVPYLVLEGQYTDPFLAMEHLRKHPVDLLFVDIQMPDITGIELVRTLTNPPKVVFTTAYSSYAVEGFNLNAMDYLLKPISFDRFLTAVNRVRDYLELSQAAQEGIQTEEKKVPDYMFVKSNYKDVKINFSDTLYRRLRRLYPDSYHYEEGDDSPEHEECDGEASRAAIYTYPSFFYCCH